MEIEAYTKFTFPGRAGRHSQFQWDQLSFSGVDRSAEPEEHAIFRIVNGYGDDWEPFPHDEKGNFD